MVHTVNITRENNIITLEQLNHPKCVSDFIVCIQACIERGYDDIKIVNRAQHVFPNACVPIAGIVQYYTQRGKNFSFEFEESSYQNKCHFTSPLLCCDDDVDLGRTCAFPMDKIYRFKSSYQVTKLSQAYVDAISHLCVCEEGVIDSISWCIDEVMENVLIHSEAGEGFVMAQYHPSTNHIAFCVYDSGIGVFNSLKNTEHMPRTEMDALSLAVQEGVGDGKGQGNGLFGLYASILRNSGILSLTSGSSSMMLTNSGETRKFKHIPILGDDAKSTTVDFQINLNVKIDFSTVFSTIAHYDTFDPRIDEMLSETDEYIHYNVFQNSQGTATRESGKSLRNDVINVLRRERRVMILDFLQVQIVSSSFIDEFIAKLVVSLGFVMFNRRIRINNMNDNVKLLCERSIYMRISEEWNKRPSIQ